MTFSVLDFERKLSCICGSVCLEFMPNTQSESSQGMSIKRIRWILAVIESLSLDQHMTPSFISNLTSFKALPFNNLHMLNEFLRRRAHG